MNHSSAVLTLDLEVSATLGFGVDSIGAGTRDFGFDAFWYEI